MPKDVALAGEVMLADVIAWDYPQPVPTVGENIRRLRESQKLTQAELAGRMGIQQGTLSNLENDRRGLPETPTMLKLAKALQCDINELLAEVDEEYSRALLTLARAEEVLAKATLERAKRYERQQIRLTSAAVPDFVAIPLLKSRIAAGNPLVITGDVETYLAFQDVTARRFTDPVCLRVGPREESMVPTIMPGDVIVIDQDPRRRTKPAPGRIYALNLDEGGTVKRVELQGGTLIVTSDNPDKTKFPTRLVPLEGRDLKQIIVGEVVWFARYTEGGRGR